MRASRSPPPRPCSRSWDGVTAWPRPPRRGHPHTNPPPPKHPAGASATGSQTNSSIFSPARQTPSTTPTANPLRLETPGVVQCDGFQDNFVDFLSGTQTTFYDRNGEPVQLVIHAEHTSNDVNSVTGFTVHEHGHLTLSIDLITGTMTITGNQEIVNLPHQGVVLQDTGRVIVDAEGALLFFAGGRKHSQLFQGEEIFCDILA